MTRPLAVLVLASILAACGDDDSVSFTLPELDTPFALLGTTSAGRPLRPSALQVVDLRPGAAPVSPTFTAGGDVDAVWAGLDTVDFPSTLGPPELSFVRSGERGARALPPLYTPHVLRVPSPPDAPEPLVPVDAGDVSLAVREERRARLDALLSDVGIDEPCRPPRTGWTVDTPRISPEAAVTARAMSDGTTVLGFVSTATVVLGVLSVDDQALAVIGAGNLRIDNGARATVRALDGAEITHPSGARLPAALSVNIDAGFTSEAQLLMWRDGRWRAEPDFVQAGLRNVRGLREVVIEGERSWCAFGASRALAQSAAIIACRALAGGPWTQVAVFDGRFGITELIEGADGTLWAIDLGGTIHRRARTATQWSIVSETAVNAGCDTLCATLGEITSSEGAFGTADGFWVAGNSAQLLRLDFVAGSFTAGVPAGIDDALFGDERPSAVAPVDFVAAHESPDGALWLATERGVLLRRDPSGTFERICRPDGFAGVEVAALASHPDGRLIMSGRPVLIARTSWTTER